MRRTVVVMAALAALVAAAPASAHTAPAWWRDAKFGIFIHWGPYSVPAWGPVSDADKATNITNYAEWYGETMTLQGSATWRHHLETYGPDLNYDDFIGRWKASHWDPDAWIRLFEQAGAKYFVLTTKHHDGVALWCTKVSHRDTCDMGPHRDLVGDLMAAAHRAGDRVKPGLYFSIPEWFNPAPKEGFLYSDNSRWDSSTRLAFSYAFENPAPRRNPYTQQPVPYTGYEPVSDFATGIVKPQAEELIHEFKPSILWCDIGGRETYFHSNAWIDDYYRTVPDGVVNDRCGDLSTQSDYATVELPTDTAKPPFEVVQGLAGRGSSFGYNAAEPESGYQTVPVLLDTLVDTVARGGNLMLDIGPRADGSIPQVMVDRLRAIGAWLEVNGEAIYDSHAWSHEAAADVRFTVGRAGFLYATSLKAPGRQLTIDAPVPVSDRTRIALLGADARALTFHRDGGRLVVDLPAGLPAHSVLRIGPKLSARVTARRRGRVVRGRLVLPGGVTRAMGCRGTVVVGRRRAHVRRDCSYRVGAARGRRARFAGNPVVRSALSRVRR